MEQVSTLNSLAMETRFHLKVDVFYDISVILLLQNVL